MNPLLPPLRVHRIASAGMRDGVVATLKFIVEGVKREASATTNPDELRAYGKVLDLCASWLEKFGGGQ